jgi:hypothetical protein
MFSRNDEEKYDADLAKALANSLEKKPRGPKTKWTRVRYDIPGGSRKKQKTGGTSTDVSININNVDWEAEFDRSNEERKKKFKEMERQAISAKNVADSRRAFEEGQKCEHVLRSKILALGKGDIGAGLVEKHGPCLFSTYCLWRHLEVKHLKASDWNRVRAEVTQNYRVEVLNTQLCLRACVCLRLCTK